MGGKMQRWRRLRRSLRKGLLTRMSKLWRCFDSGIFGINRDISRIRVVYRRLCKCIQPLFSRRSRGHGYWSSVAAHMLVVYM
ncbi:hypothetical protein I7I50_08724 [Histoplasma capsulatum G186AR]|uniref:Uncharacterized protein n=1 Tax=Ajellomyces capsulatus TaxID=5037 RepID=A0A8H7YUA8_AJECA|nr:hypothetical protein I7I52_06238 [Histoplasma capsulatum]QSS73812.1 hypothetical protein I7I50_08724 [Histoplasma capsulatum G186AR]